MDRGDLRIHLSQAVAPIIFTSPQALSAQSIRTLRPSTFVLPARTTIIPLLYPPPHHHQPALAFLEYHGAKQQSTFAYEASEAHILIVASPVGRHLHWIGLDELELELAWRDMISMIGLHIIIMA